MTSSEYNLGGAGGAETFLNLPVGLKLRLASGAIGELIGNPGDGAFVLVRIDENEKDPSQVGNEELVFFNDVKEVISDGPAS